MKEGVEETIGGWEGGQGQNRKMIEEGKKELREGQEEGEQLGTWMDFGNGRGLVSPGPSTRPSPSLAPTPTDSLGWPPEGPPDLSLSCRGLNGGREGGREVEAEGWGRVDGQPYLKLSSGFLRLILDVRV